MSGRITRRLGWDRNPLRRPSDRIETRCTALLLVLLVIAGPVLAWWAASATYRSDLRTQEWERTHRFEVQAVLIAVPEVAEPAAKTRPPAATGMAPVRWSAPDGTDRTGDLRVPTTAQAGDQVPVWVDERGTLAGPPARRSPRGEAVIVAVAILLVVATALAMTRSGLVAALDARRMREWEQEWLRVGPRWSRQR